MKRDTSNAHEADLRPITYIGGVPTNASDRIFPLPPFLPSRATPPQLRTSINDEPALPSDVECVLVGRRALHADNRHDEATDSFFRRIHTGEYEIGKVANRLPPTCAKGMHAVSMGRKYLWLRGRGDCYYYLKPTNPPRLHHPPIVLSPLWWCYDHLVCELVENDLCGVTKQNHSSLNRISARVYLVERACRGTTIASRRVQRFRLFR